MLRTKEQRAISKLKKCLVEKDERITTLEELYKNLEKRKEDIIRWFNFSAFFILSCVIVGILVAVCFLSPAVVPDVTLCLSVVAIVYIFSNVTLSIYAIMFDMDDDDVAFAFVVFNIIVLPIIVAIAVLTIVSIQRSGG